MPGTQGCEWFRKGLKILMGGLTDGHGVRVQYSKRICFTTYKRVPIKIQGNVQKSACLKKNAHSLMEKGRIEFSIVFQQPG